MAFYNRNVKAPKDWYATFSTDLHLYSFDINHDYSLTTRLSLDLLEELINTNEYCTLPFSGGADSTFMMYCYAQLVREKRIDPAKVDIVTVLCYSLDGTLLSSGIDAVTQLTRSLDLPTRFIDIVLDERVDRACLQIIANECEYNIGKLLQYYIFSLCEGTIIIPEGRPMIYRRPQLKGCIRDGTPIILDVCASYERENRINLFSYSQALFASFLTNECVHFKPNNHSITYAERNRRHDSKIPLYNYIFPMNQLDKIPSATSLGVNLPKTAYIINKILSHSKIQLHEEESLFSLSDYYGHSFSAINKNSEIASCLC